MVSIQLPDGSRREFDGPVTVAEVAASIGAGLAKAALAGKIGDKLGYPCFVKPANLGSSVGIAKARSRAELEAALDSAASFDRRLIVEAAAGGKPREVECAVLGNDQPLASLPGEIVPQSAAFYDYQAKYISADGARLEIPANLSEAQTTEIQQLAVRAFQAIDGSGLGRVDFFLEKGTGKLLLNEINTMPGFTSISMYPKLWEASGLPYSQLIDRLIELAFERHREKSRNVTSFS